MPNIIKKNTEAIVAENSSLYDFSRELIINSRKIVYQTANFGQRRFCVNLAIAFALFLPFSSGKLRKMLNI
jgi:hypothetical protein